MAKKEKKDRKSRLKSMVTGTGVSKQYLDYKDYDPKDIHEGKATLGAYTFTDAPGTALGSYGRAVKTGHGKTLFRFQGKLYKTTNLSGTTSEQVKT